MTSSRRQRSKNDANNSYHIFEICIYFIYL